MYLVEPFIAEENLKRNWMDKLFNNYPVFYVAQDLNIDIKTINTEQPFIAKPSKIKRMIASMMIAGGISGWFLILLMVLNNILLPISIVFLCLISVWLGLMIWTFFIDPKQPKIIVVDKNKIQLDKQTFEWSKISAYLLMVKGSFRNELVILVLFIENKDIIKFNLTNLNKSGREIMKCIELYKS